MADTRTRYLADHTARIICAAIDREPETVAALIGEVGATYGHDAVFGVCCALAEAIRQLVFPEVARGDGSLTGDMIAIETDRDPATREKERRHHDDRDGQP